MFYYPFGTAMKHNMRSKYKGFMKFFKFFFSLKYDTCSNLAVFIFKISKVARLFLKHKAIETLNKISI